MQEYNLLVKSNKYCKSNHCISKLSSIYMHKLVSIFNNDVEKHA